MYELMAELIEVRLLSESNWDTHTHTEQKENMMHKLDFPPQMSQNLLIVGCCLNEPHYIDRL